MDLEVDSQFNELIKSLEKDTGEALDLQAIIFMVGLQELNFGFREFSKDEKLNVMHVGVCSILSPYGYYKFLGRDEDGWPHFEALDKLPFLQHTEQQQLLKRAILQYFDY
jgi:hypothetical protein